MKLIDNLEELKVGDYICCPREKYKMFIYKIVGVNNEAIQVKCVRERRYVLSESVEYYSSYSNLGEDIIPKNAKKNKKRKLRHKIVTHNDEWIIHKLSEKEKERIIKEGVLSSLER